MTLSLLNGVLRSKDSHPLLLKCCKILLMQPLKSQALLVHPYRQEWGMMCHNCQNHSKILDSSCTLTLTLCRSNVVLWYNESHSLLLTYLKILLGYLYQKEYVYTAIYQPLWGAMLGHNHHISIPKDLENE